MRQQSLLVEAGASQWTASILRETSADSWFSFGTSDRIAAVHSGTRPGDNLADMLFTFLFAEVSKMLRTKLQEAGLRVELPWHPEWLLVAPDNGPDSNSSASPLDVTWMDDLAVLLWADGPRQMIESDLIEALRTAATVTIDSCVQAPLLPNHKAGKTEALLHLIGPESRRLREAVFSCSEPMLELHGSIWTGARLRLVATYKHLGGLLHVDGRHFANTAGKSWPHQLPARETRLCFLPHLLSLPSSLVLVLGPGLLQLKRKSSRLPLLQRHTTCSARTFRFLKPATSAHSSCSPALEFLVPVPPSTSRDCDTFGRLLLKPAVTCGRFFAMKVVGVILCSPHCSGCTTPCHSRDPPMPRLPTGTLPYLSYVFSLRHGKD